MLQPMRRGRRTRRAALVATSIALLAFAAAAAAHAGDANGLPPRVQLLPGGTKGQESIIGPQQVDLAYFATEEPDESWGYTPGSVVTFECFVDAAKVPCGAHYYGCCRHTGGAPRPASRALASESLRFGLGRFVGSVPVPAKLASGPHTVRVVATDDDGTDRQPPAIPVLLDRQAPAAPVLTKVPPQRSRIHKPVFRFSASDGQQLVGRRENIFTAWLRRLNPPGAVYRSWSDADSFLNMWFARCPTLLTCSTRAQAAYMANEHWYSYGEPEWLVPGVYELRVRARDAVGNKSPLTSYRFRILRGEAR